MCCRYEDSDEDDGPLVAPPGDERERDTTEGNTMDPNVPPSHPPPPPPPPPPTRDGIAESHFTIFLDLIYQTIWNIRITF